MAESNKPGQRVASDSSLDDLQARAANSASNKRPVEAPGAIIGPYKLLQQIGSGGFGRVYMAEQQQPIRRRVALKIIKLGMDTASVIARFEAERQALAMMEHPNIARVLDAGATDAGRPYFVMELVRGAPITEYCDANRLNTRQRLELFTAVCQAVQHAHQKGVIHRDIKPNNVMVTLHDGAPVPKVIDFGIAKATQARLTEKTLFTQYGQFLGTPAYMSPEQAEMSGLDVDTRSDVYSLGVLLYELLTGDTPLDQTKLHAIGYAEMQRMICQDEPPKPSTRVSTTAESLTTICDRRRTEPKKLGRVLRGELDWIVMKALEKDRTRRYETANALGMDVRRFLNDEPVLAGPPSAGYQFRKLARKNAKLLITALSFTVLLTASIAISTWLTFHANRAEADAIAERNRTVFRFTELARGGGPENVKYLRDFATLTFLEASRSGDWDRAADDLAIAAKRLGDRQPQWWQTNWWIFGPLAIEPNMTPPTGALLDPVQPLPRLRGRSSQQWLPCVAHTSGLLDIGRVLKERGISDARREHISVFAQTRIYCSRERQAAIDISADDWARLWLNGRQLNNNREGRLVSSIRLQPGWNTLLAKVDNELGDCTLNMVPLETRVEFLAAEAAHRHARANSLAERGEWRQAAENFRQACEWIDEERHWSAYLYGITLLQLGDDAAFREHCARMITALGGTHDPTTAERTAKLCLLSTANVVDLERAAQLAEFSATAGKDHDFRVWFLLTLGIAQYRLGRFEEALETLGQCHDDAFPRREAHVVFFEAMTLHRLGRPGAESKFQQAKKLVADDLEQMEAGVALINWHDVVACKFTHDEARALIFPSP